MSIYNNIVIRKSAIITTPAGNRDDTVCVCVCVCVHAWASATVYEANGLACREKGTVANRK